ncbi:MAG TPA: hypothetical protein PLW44_05620 [Chitinophagales bacterium]|nr:hypothetical protein [Chitinophagales bacterium]
MHDIEPYYLWRDYYIASEDKLSPFYRRLYSEFEFKDRIYNFYIHPQWDNFGSSTLYCKVLFADYEQQYCVIELIGEWNDAVHNDIMELKRTVIDPMVEEGIVKFILIGENVLNFHASDELYYEEWYEDIKDEAGWIVLLNFRHHVITEMKTARLHYFMQSGGVYDDFAWRKFKPYDLMVTLEDALMRSLQ